MKNNLLELAMSTVRLKLMARSALISKFRECTGLPIRHISGVDKDRDAGTLTIHTPEGDVIWKNFSRKQQRKKRPGIDVVMEHLYFGKPKKIQLTAEEIIDILLPSEEDARIVAAYINTKRAKKAGLATGKEARR